MLNWNEHISYVSLKISRGVGALNRARYLVPRNLLLLLYHSLIHPHLLYCNIVWGSAAAVHLNKLVLLQKRAIRILSGSLFRAHTSPIFSELKLLKLIDLNKYLILLFLFKYKHSLLPASCSHLVSINSNYRTHNTRHCFFFTHPPCRTSCLQRCISHRGPLLWDSLPTTISQLSYMLVFSKSTLAHFLSTY